MGNAPDPIPARGSLQLYNYQQKGTDALGDELGLAAILNKFESGLVCANAMIDITDEVRRFNQTK
ncbi:MAG TPA: hypothetical protein VEB66_12785 [Opitutaceae bacterium]|nr:hypothetical protein [Opitutaceae bacterium]